MDERGTSFWLVRGRAPVRVCPDFGSFVDDPRGTGFEAVVSSRQRCEQWLERKLTGSQTTVPKNYLPLQAYLRLFKFYQMIGVNECF